MQSFVSQGKVTREGKGKGADPKRFSREMSAQGVAMYTTLVGSVGVQGWGGGCTPTKATGTTLGWQQRCMMEASCASSLLVLTVLSALSTCQETKRC